MRQGVCVRVPIALVVFQFQLCWVHRISTEFNFDGSCSFVFVTASTSNLMDFQSVVYPSCAADVYTFLCALFSHSQWKSNAVGKKVKACTTFWCCKKRGMKSTIVEVSIKLLKVFKNLITANKLQLYRHLNSINQQKRTKQKQTTKYERRSANHRENVCCISQQGEEVWGAAQRLPPTNATQIRNCMGLHQSSLN